MLTILNNPNIVPGTLTDHVHQLISLISSKHIKVRVGRCARISDKHVIELPPLPADATRIDFIKYLCKGLHEQAHIYGGSRFDTGVRDAMLFGLMNALEDTRCERLQEIEYPGIKPYRIEYYGIVLDEQVNSELFNITSRDIGAFVGCLGKYIIIKLRKIQLNAPHIDVHPSKDLVEVYEKHVADLEPQMLTMSTFDEMVVLANTIYGRIRDIIREEMEKRARQQKQQPQPKQESDDDNDVSDGSQGSSEDDSDESESSNGSGGSNEDDDKTNASDQNKPSDEASEETGTLSNETEGDRNEEDDETDSDTSNSNHEQSDESDEADQSGGESRDREECPGKEDGEEEGSEGDQSPADDLNASADPEDNETGEGPEPREADPEADGSSEADQSPESGSSGGCGDRDEEEVNEDGDNDTGESSDSDSDHSIRDNADSNPDGDLSEDVPGADQKPDDDIDPEEIERQVDDAIDEINQSVSSMNIMDETTEQINRAAETCDEYMVDPSVIDVIEEGRETSEATATTIRDKGVEMLGPYGTRLTPLFVSMTKPITRYGKRHGSLDIVSFATDIHDVRKNIRSVQIGATLEKAAVTFMMDNSSSMSEIILDMYAIMSGTLLYLSKACIPTEVIGYTVDSGSSGECRTAPLHITIVKEFSEPYNGEVLRRCVPPLYMQYTDDLDCMRYAVPRLWARPEKKKVIMVLCDGCPNLGNGELTAKNEKAYKEYIQILRKAGIIVFGIGINCDLSEYFGSDFASVDPSNVGRVLLDKLTGILNRRRE